MNSPANILLVDDEPRNLDVLESFLQSSDYRLVRAVTPDQALRALLDGEFAVIVLDIRMPEMSGLELADLIKQRKRTQHIPIIFLTAYYQDDKDILEGYGMGAVDYLSKPVNPQILNSKISVFVDLFRKSRALSMANLALEQEVVRRRSAEEALREVNNELERRVQDRTADLTKANAMLLEREGEVVMARDRAMAASRAKDDFFARLSHELRTPLHPVLLIAGDAAANAALPAAVRADFKKIADNVELEARLIDDLLDLTRIAEGKLTLESRPFDFKSVIQDAVDMVGDDANKKQLKLGLRLPPDMAPMFGDDVRLRQVFWNVLKNAVKFTPPAGTVDIEVRRLSEDGHFEVRISDTGIGMTPMEIDHVFEAFWQGHQQALPTIPVGTPRFGGLGLGLAISRMLVEAHGGSIRAESAGPDQGSTFIIELVLPAAPAPAPSLDPAPTATAESPTASPMPRHRILLVEDHQPTAAVLTQLLARRGYEILSATCLAEAREILAREKFDILISDLGLPDGNGCELMGEVRTIDGLVGIALTGYGMDDDLSRSRAAGFAAHLTKPVRMQELDRVLQTVLASGPRAPRVERPI